MPILLFDDECGGCRHIGAWVKRAALVQGGARLIDVRPIGEDPQALLALNPALSIWDAYDTVHLLMPDGSMKLGGQAIAELLRRLPATRWFAWCFALSVFGWQPFQQLMNVAYAILADVRPVFGCESCGIASPWVRPFVWLSKKAKALFASAQTPAPSGRHFTPR
jgi:predicted DCC family thiol-disulfide oxidoreductase YuxK